MRGFGRRESSGKRCSGSTKSHLTTVGITDLGIRLEKENNVHVARYTRYRDLVTFDVHVEQAIPILRVIALGSRSERERTNNMQH